MRIGDLEQHCGNCKIIDFCADPFEDLCLCTDSRLAEIEEIEYKRFAEENRHLDNEKILEAFCKAGEKE